MPKKKTKNKIQVIIFLCCISIVLTDQIIKFFILKNFQAGQSLPVIKSIFHITLVFNSGGAFGMFANATSMLIFAPVFVIFAISVFLARRNSGYGIQAALASIVAGAVSNLADRLRFGYVVDFLDFRIWPVFNIADAAITLGTLWLLCKIMAKAGKDASGSV